VAAEENMFLQAEKGIYGSETHDGHCICEGMRIYMTACKRAEDVSIRSNLH
jgi:hypothetical protein